MKTKSEIPKKENLAAANKEIFNTLEKNVGFVPNLYAMMAHSENALSTFLNAQNAKSSLTNKEKESVSLVVSQVNECEYCLSAHSFLGRKAGLTDDQIMEIRSGSAKFNSKLDALVTLTKSMAESRGHVSESIIDSFFAAGYTRENLSDLVILVSLQYATNYMYGVTKPEIDWPLAPVLTGNNK